MLKVFGVSIFFCLLFLIGCQKSGGGSAANTPAGQPPGGVIPGCPAVTPACPSGEGTCAYLTWQDSSIGDPTVPGPILFNIYYGNNSGVYTSQISAIDGLCYQITGLTPGTYYFAATAYNANGSSAYSNEGTKTVNLTADDLKNDSSQKVMFETPFVVTGK